MTFVAGTVLTAAALNTALASKTDTAMTQNAQTGTSYSYALADASKLLSMSNAASNTVLVTKQATVTWVTGTQLRVVNLGAGVTTLVADTGVTINGNAALKQYQGGTLIRTASDVWLFVPTASSSGMDLITPTSVAGSGVTLSGGQVTFTTATTVSVNGCFSAAYDNYVIKVTGTCTASDPLANIRMRLAGTDDSASAYYAQELYISGAAAIAQRLAVSTSVRLGVFGTTRSAVSIDVYSPAIATPTVFQSVNVIRGPSTAVEAGQWAGGHNVSTAFDGFSIIPSTSNITGTLRIYGVRNS